MLQQPTDSSSDLTPASRPRYSTRGRQVRMVLLTWPMVALLGATASTATCLFTDCHLCGRKLAKETLVGDVGSIKSTAFRPDGTMLSSVGHDGSITIWDMETRPASAFMPRGLGPVHCIAFSPDNQLLAAGNASAVVSFYDLDRDCSRPLDDTPAATLSATCLAFSPDGATLAVGQADGKITLWDAATGRSGPAWAAMKISWWRSRCVDGATLASSGSGHNTRVWDVSTGRQRCTITARVNTVSLLLFARWAVARHGRPGKPGRQALGRDQRHGTCVAARTCRRHR